MSSTALTARRSKQDLQRHFAKTAILWVMSFGLLWFSENFSAENLFEYQSTGWVLWTSYAKDLIQPFAFYFFLCLGERWLKTWRIRALIAFGLPLLLEISQFFYYRVSAGHYIGAFDPIDIVMYAVSIGLAVFVEQKVFARLFAFWSPEES